MSKDRIKELQANNSWSTVTYSKLPQECVNHEEQTQGQNMHHNSFSVSMDDKQSPITDFLQETNVVQTMIEKIAELSQQVKNIHIQILERPPDDKLGEILNQKNEEINKLSHESSKRLKQMKESQENSPDFNQSNAHRRIKESQIFVLIRRFHDAMAEHNKEAIAQRERCKEAIICELEMTGQQRNRDEIEKLLENDGSTALNFHILIDTEKAKKTLNDAKSRHLDFLKLEEHIKELCNMFQDFEMLVSEQGELMDQIEHNVEKATDYVKDAAEDVHIAENYRKKALSKKKIIVILLISIIAVLIVMVFTIFFVPRQILGR